MPVQNGFVAPKLLNVNEAAERLGLSVSYLNKRRLSGGGPAYVKIGSSVKYDSADLADWLAGMKRSSTSDPRATTARPDAETRNDA